MTTKTPVLSANVTRNQAGAAVFKCDSPGCWSFGSFRVALPEALVGPFDACPGHLFDLTAFLFDEAKRLA